MTRRCTVGSSLAVLVLAVSSSPTARAQAPCLEGPQRLYTGPYQGALVFPYDDDFDGDIDLMYGQGSLRRFRNDGTGQFVYAPPDVSPIFFSNVTAFDMTLVDGDTAPDIVYVDRITQKLVVTLHSTFGTAGSGSAYSTQTSPNGLAVGDVDGDGDRDIIVTSSSANSFAVFFNDGNNSFAPTGPLVSYQSDPLPEQPELEDFNGDGKLDLALLHVGASNHISIYPGNGNGTFQFPITLPVGLDVMAISSHDLNGDGRADLAITNAPACFGCNSTFEVRLQQPNGVMAPPVAYPLGCSPFITQFADVDTDGDLDAITNVGCGLGCEVALGNGNGTFAAPVTLVVPGQAAAVLCAADVDGDRDNDLIMTQSLIVSTINDNRLEVFRSCLHAGTPYCAGDGSATACPCGNSSVPGANVGCSSSLGIGGSLRGNGIAQLSNDTVSLFGSQMPGTSTVLYFQGNIKVNGGSGNVFGDGLQCAGGTVVRLAVRLNASGASAYPTGADPDLHVQGGVAAPGERHYQAWYRDNANFCTPSGFNLTNALALRWIP